MNNRSDDDKSFGAAVKSSIYKAERWLWGVGYGAFLVSAFLATLPLMGTVLVLTTALNFVLGGMALMFTLLESGWLGLFQICGEISRSPVLSSSGRGAHTLLFSVLAGIIFGSFPFIGASFLLWPSVLLGIAGVSLVIGALSALRLQFWSPGPILKPESLHTEGVYSVVRHPLYTGMLFSSLGVAGFTDSGTRAALALMLYPVLHERARREEQLLLEEYAEDYAQYAKNVPAFVPFAEAEIIDKPVLPIDADSFSDAYLPE